MSVKDKYYIERINFQDCREWVLKKHYAHRIPSISYAFGLLDDNKILQGVCTFGEPASPPLKKGLMGGLYKNIIYELNRLVINQNEKNLTSYFVSRCLKKMIKPSIIISYSDEGQNHYGYIYQACNFIYTGRTKERTDIFCGENKHCRHYDKNSDYSIRQNRSAKHRYIYFLGSKKQVKEMKKNLKYEIKPYPKGNNKNYDANYQPIVQGRLF